MVIVLKGADFSANNIGKIDIPVEISSFTKAAILASGRSSMAIEQQVALDKFFDSLGAIDGSGVWGKIRKMYIPFLTDSLAHTFVNYKTNIAEATPKSEYYGFKSKGIANISGDRVLVANGICTDTNFVWNWDNISVLMMYTENIVNANIGCQSEGNKYEFISNVSSSGTYYALRLYQDNTTNALIPPTQVNNGIEPCLRGVSCLGDDVVLMGTEYNPITNIKRNTITPTTNKGNLYPYGNLVGTTDANFTPLGCLILGDAMSEDEMVLIRSAVNKLWHAFSL